MASRPLPLLPRLPRWQDLQSAGARGTLTAPAIAAAGLFTAFLVASLLVRDVKLGVVLLVGLCFIPVALLRLPLAICCWVVLLFFFRAPAIHSVPDHLLIVIAACWIGLLVGRRAEAREALARNQGVMFAGAVLIAWILVTLAWAPNPHAASRSLKDLLYAALSFVILLGTIVERRHVRWVLWAFVVGAALSVLWGAAKGGLSGAIGGPGLVTDQDGRFQAGSGDPNYLAMVLVPAIMLAAGLAFRASPMQRAGLGVCVVLAAIGLAATQSRGGVLAALVSAIVALLIWRGRRAQIAAMIVVALMATAAFFAASPAAWQRVHAGNTSGSGRVDIWQVAWRVGNDHPIFGVGIHQFAEYSPRYVRQPGALDYVDLIVDKHIVVHNVYLELWVETGIIGLLLYLGFVVACLAAAWRAKGLFERMGDSEMATLARTVVLATVGMLAASFFLSNVSNHQSWVLLALGPVLASIAIRDQTALAEQLIEHPSSLVDAPPVAFAGDR